MDLCITVPGIEAVAAANIIAEIGVNMEQFASAQHLASWAGRVQATMKVQASA